MLIAPFTAICVVVHVNVAPKFTVNEPIVVAGLVTLPAPVVAITMASVVAGTAFPTHVAGVVHAPPVAVLVIVVACSGATNIINRIINVLTFEVIEQ